MACGLSRTSTDTDKCTKLNRSAPHTNRSRSRKHAFRAALIVARTSRAHQRLDSGVIRLIEGKHCFYALSRSRYAFIKCNSALVKIYLAISQSLISGVNLSERAMPITYDNMYYTCRVHAVLSHNILFSCYPTGYGSRYLIDG